MTVIALAISLDEDFELVKAGGVVDLVRVHLSVTSVREIMDDDGARAFAAGERTLDRRLKAGIRRTPRKRRRHNRHGR
jgi:hypothetical protein